MRTKQVDWRDASDATVLDLREIDGRIYQAIYFPILVDDEYETKLRWHLASRKDANRFREKAQREAGGQIAG